MIVPVATPVDMSYTLEVIVPEDFLALGDFDNAMSAAMRDMANEARDFWVSEAGRRLKSTRSEYQQAISVGDVGDLSFSVKLSGGPLPYALEVGAQPYLMNIKRGQIVPLNVDRQQVFSNPKVFRTGSGDPWQHPGFPGMNIAAAVQEEIENNIVPKHINKALGKI
jgi:hypothetical protein